MDRDTQILKPKDLRKLQRESAIRESQELKRQESILKTEEAFKKEQDKLFADQEKRRQTQLSRHEKQLNVHRKSDEKKQNREDSVSAKEQKVKEKIDQKQAEKERKLSKKSLQEKQERDKRDSKARKKRGKNRKDPLAFADVEPRRSTIFLPPRYSEASQTEDETKENELDDKKRKKGRLISEVKDLTLVVSGLLDQVQAKRENVMYLELSNANLCKHIEFQREVVEKLENDLSAIEKDYKKADRQYQKGQKKSVVDKYYLKKNQELQLHIVESNIDLFVDMTVNDEILPNVYRKLRAERMQEKKRCIEQLRDRILRKRCELMRVQDSVAEQGKSSDAVCKKSEDLQRQIEDMGYSDHEAETISRLRSVAYCLGYVQYQMDILTKETAYVKELITSKRNEFANQLRLRSMVLGDKVQALQDAVASALHMALGPKGEKVARVSKCVRPRALPDERKDWIMSQITLSQVQKQITKAEYDNLCLDNKFLLTKMHGKLTRLRARLLFTLEKQKQVLTATRCEAAKQTEEVLFTPSCAVRIDD